jgi:hypothetical protein
LLPGATGGVAVARGIFGLHSFGRGARVSTKCFTLEGPLNSRLCSA